MVVLQVLQTHKLVVNNQLVLQNKQLEIAGA
jgi:hypothetical protein